MDRLKEYVAARKEELKESKDELVAQVNYMAGALEVLDELENLMKLPDEPVELPSESEIAPEADPQA